MKFDEKPSCTNPVVEYESCEHLLFSLLRCGEIRDQQLLGMQADTLLAWARLSFEHAQVLTIVNTVRSVDRKLYERVTCVYIGQFSFDTEAEEAAG